jgi:hypothetical protein
MRLILTAFFDLLTKDEKDGNLMPDNATAHETNNSMNVLAEDSGERVISQGLWPARSPDLKPCNFHLWGTLNDKVYVNNYHSLRELKENIRQGISVIPRKKLRRV